MAKPRSDLKAVISKLVIAPLPTSAQTSLMLDQAVISKLGISPKFWLPLGRERDVDADSLHCALRAAVDGKKTTMLAFRDGSRERVKLGRQRGGKATLILSKERFAFSNADLLASDRRARVTAFRRALEDRPLLVEEEKKWKAIVEERVLTDREYDELMTALSATPEAVRNDLQKPRNLDADTLIPDEGGYYRRLIAPLGKATSLDAFIRDELASARRGLLEHHPERALRRMAFAALSQPLIPFDLLVSVPVSDVESLLKADDPFSLLFGFELCSYRLSADTGFAELGRSFLEKLLLVNDSTSRCNIFSAVALISTTKLRQAARASNAPLFWIRLAALAHAGVLTDALSDMSDSERFLRWAMQNFSATYAWHSLIDRRDAPRWKPDWISPDHLYAELVGRVLEAARMVPEASRPVEWVSAIDAALLRLQESGKALAAYFPGPLEDFRETLPGSSRPEVFDEIEAKLGAATLLNEVPGIFALAYATRPSDRVVSSLLRILNLPADQPIASLEKQMAFLELCAHIAACARSEPLANAVIDRCLFEVRRPGSEASVTDAFGIMVEACASHSDSKKHRQLLETTAAKLSFAVDKAEDLSNLEAIFDILALRDEKLMPALAKARAIVRTKRGRS